VNRQIIRPLDKERAAMIDTVTSRPSPPPELLNGVGAVSASESRWEIHRCALGGVTDFESLLSGIRHGQHPIDYWDFERRLGLGVLWEWDDIRLRICAGLLTAERLDEAVHRGPVDDPSRPIHAVVPGPP